VRKHNATRGLRVFGLVTAIAFAFPGLYLVWRNFTSGADPLGLLFSNQTLQPLWRTIYLAGLVSVSAACLGTALAWLTARTDLPFRKLWSVLLPVPLVFPTFIGAAAFIRALSPGGLASEWLTAFGVHHTPQLRGLFGAWLVLTFFCYPYVYLPVNARLKQLPGSYEQTALLLGDTQPQVFLRVVLRQIGSSITAGTLLVFLYTISDFGAVQLMRFDTLTRAIEMNYLARPPISFAMSLILLALAAVVVVSERAASRHLPDIRTHRPQHALKYELGSWKVPSLLLVIATFAISIVAPVAAMADWALGGTLRSDGRPLTVSVSKIVEATINTLTSSIATGVVALLLITPIAFLANRHKDRVGKFTHSVVISTFAIPGILIALSLRFWTIRSGFIGSFFYDSMALLIFAYVVRFASLAMGAASVAVNAVPTALHDAAATLGADRRRRFRTVDVPVMKPGLLAAAGLVVLSTMKELPISLLLAPIGFPTLTTRIFSSFEEAFVAEAGIMALVLVTASAFLSWSLVLRRSDAL